jgi:transposase-like protein
MTGEHSSVYLDGVWLNRMFGGKERPEAVLVAIGVNADGSREILGMLEEAKENAASWRARSRSHAPVTLECIPRPDQSSKSSAPAPD